MKLKYGELEKSIFGKRIDIYNSRGHKLGMIAKGGYRMNDGKYHRGGISLLFNRKSPPTLTYKQFKELQNKVKKINPKWNRKDMPKK